MAPLVECNADAVHAEIAQQAANTDLTGAVAYLSITLGV